MARTDDGSQKSGQIVEMPETKPETEFHEMVIAIMQAEDRGDRETINAVRKALGLQIHSAHVASFREIKKPR